MSKGLFTKEANFRWSVDSKWVSWLGKEKEWSTYVIKGRFWKAIQFGQYWNYVDIFWANWLWIQNTKVGCENEFMKAILQFWWTVVWRLNCWNQNVFSFAILMLTKLFYENNLLELMTSLSVQQLEKEKQNNGTRGSD